MARETGKVSRWVPDRGFGFIQPTGGGGTTKPGRAGKDLFVHHSALGPEFKAPDGRKALSPGEAVTYEVEATEKGPAAVRVERA